MGKGAHPGDWWRFWRENVSPKFRRLVCGRPDAFGAGPSTACWRRAVGLLQGAAPFTSELQCNILRTYYRVHRIGGNSRRALSRVGATRVMTCYNNMVEVAKDSRIYKTRPLIRLKIAWNGPDVLRYVKNNSLIKFRKKKKIAENKLLCWL